MTLSHLSRSIAGSIAIVTGAASGMGRATARLFADEGARLGLLDRNGEALQVVAGEIIAAAKKALDAVVEVTPTVADPSATVTGMNSTTSTLKPLKKAG